MLGTLIMSGCVVLNGYGWICREKQLSLTGWLALVGFIASSIGLLNLLT